MAGVSDLPFRVLCHEQGAGLVCMEMVSAKAIYYRNKNTEALMEIEPGERPVSLQLFGSDPELMGRWPGRSRNGLLIFWTSIWAARCPRWSTTARISPHENPELVRKIVTSVVKAVQKPVTVKIRRGFDERHVNAVEIAKIIEDCGRRRWLSMAERENSIMPDMRTGTLSGR